MQVSVRLTVAIAVDSVSLKLSFSRAGICFESSQHSFSNSHELQKKTHEAKGELGEVGSGRSTLSEGVRLDDLEDEVLVLGRDERDTGTGVSLVLQTRERRGCTGSAVERSRRRGAVLGRPLSILRRPGAHESHTAPTRGEQAPFLRARGRRRSRRKSGDGRSTTVPAQAARAAAIPIRPARDERIR